MQQRLHCTLCLTCLILHCRPGNNRQVHAVSLDRLRVRDEEGRPSTEHIAQNNCHDFRRRCPRSPHLCQLNRSDYAPSCLGPILSPRSRSRAVGVPLIGPGSVGLVNLDVDRLAAPQPPTLPSQSARSSPVRLLTQPRALAFGAGRLCHAIMPSAFGRVDVRLDAFTADAPFQASMGHSGFAACSRRYPFSFGLMLLIPMVPFSITFASTALAWMWSRAIARPTLCGLRLWFTCADSAQVRELFIRGLAKSVGFLHIVYNGICMKTFLTFHCTELFDGSSFLTVAPRITCGDDEHRAMVAVSICSIVVYVIGIPAYVLCTMLYAHRHDKLKDPEWLHVLGFLYARYGTAHCSHACTTARS